MRIVDYIKQLDFRPRVGLILGSGLGGFVDKMNILGAISFADVDDMPTSTVEGHIGRFVFGYVDKTPIVAMQGRIHYYEGYSVKDVVSPIYRMYECGIEEIVITNAAGGINPDFRSGNLMLIRDHIMMVPNPLIGLNDDKYSVRFPDMSNIYDSKLRDKIKQIAAIRHLPLTEGVYVQLSGPSYETPSEIAMWGKLGADAVGMSTACEAVIANYLGIKTIGVSCITNMAAGLQTELSHAEVLAAGKIAEADFVKLIELIMSINTDI